MSIGCEFYRKMAKCLINAARKTSLQATAGGKLLHRHFVPPDKLKPVLPNSVGLLLDPLPGAFNVTQLGLRLADAHAQGDATV